MIFGCVISVFIGISTLAMDTGIPAMGYKRFAEGKLKLTADEYNLLYHVLNEVNLFQEMIKTHRKKE